MSTGRLSELHVLHGIFKRPECHLHENVTIVQYTDDVQLLACGRKQDIDMLMKARMENSISAIIIFCAGKF